jgi:hypothetical protein
MSEYDAKRRQLLQFLLLAPIGLTLSCGRPGYEAPALSSEQSLKKLILILGPWSATEQGEGEDFAGRFLASKVTSGSYLPDSAELVQSLARRFADGTVSVNEIKLGELPLEERTVLLNLAKQIYSLTETRFMMTGQPAVGECQDDATMHTRRPT